MLQKRLPSGFISLERTSKCVVNILLRELSHVYYCLVFFFPLIRLINYCINSQCFIYCTFVMLVMNMIEIR